MSAECERAFSSSKLMISPARNQLGDHVVEYLKAWWKKDMVAQDEEVTARLSSS
jgi:hypothetical protein